MMFHSAIIKLAVMKILNKYFSFLLILLTFTTVQAQDIPKQPQPPHLVNDLAGIMTPEQIQQLESRLVAFNDSTSTQIAVVTLKSLNGYTATEMAERIGNLWTVGQKKYNNGMVILIKPKTADERGDAAIATGYGLEGKLPDVVCKRIVEQVMIPAFKQNDYAAGIEAGTVTVMKFATGEYKDSTFGAKRSGKKSPIVPLIILIVMAIIVMRGFKGRGNHHSIGHNMPLWPFLFMGGLGGFGGGGENRGGGGFGGGFGGFGGGGFGGGGAGGSW